MTDSKQHWRQDLEMRPAKGHACMMNKLTRETEEVRSVKLHCSGAVSSPASTGVSGFGHFRQKSSSGPKMERTLNAEENRNQGMGRGLVHERNDGV